MGRLERTSPSVRGPKRLRIDATGAPPGLVGRMVIGSYVTGQDHVTAFGRPGLSVEQRAEIHRAVDRLLGASVMEEGPELIEVQTFLDPGKHELPRLLHRVVQMVRYELELCRQALEAKAPGKLARVGAIEEEVDRISLLMARQLLLSSENPRVARDIDVESPHFQIGYRLVVKVLEMVGDLVQELAANLVEQFPALARAPSAAVRDLAGRIGRLEEILGRTMAAFESMSIVDANDLLDRIARERAKVTALGSPSRTGRGPSGSGAMPRLLCEISAALGLLASVNETTINRRVEPETIALTGAGIVKVLRGGARAPHDRHGPSPAPLLEQRVGFAPG